MHETHQQILQSLLQRVAALEPQQRRRIIDDCVRLLQLEGENASDPGATVIAPDRNAATESLHGVLTDATAGVGASVQRLDQTPRPSPEPVGDSREPTARGRIGPYELKSVIGEGGMGTVYLAEQTAPVRRTVAIKMSRDAVVSPEVLQRFELERQSLAMMDHDGIARLLEAGQTADGRPWFVMEYVSGSPVTDYCRQRSLPLEDRLHIFRAVCDAIQHAHQRSVIHRDIKPGNVLVRDGSEEAAARIKVIDFGLARLLDTPAEAGSEPTIAGQVLGTVRYMSPEQAGGSRQLIDTRADVYSLGVLLYELVTGTTPITASDLSGMSLTEALRQVQEQSIPLMSSRLRSLSDDQLANVKLTREDAESLARRVTGDLSVIAGQALQSDPNERYQSVAALSDDVQRYLEFRPILARRPSAAYVGLRFLRRHRLAAAVTIATVALMAFAIWNGVRAERRNAALRVEAAENERRLSDSQASLQLARTRSVADALDASERDRIILELAGPADQSQSLLDRQQAIREALRMDVMDAAGRCELQLAELELLDALLDFDELKRQLGQVRPVTEEQAAQLQMWRVRANPSTTAEHAAALDRLRAGASTFLAPADQGYLEAITSPSRAVAIIRLEKLLQQWPQHTAARKLLIGCLLFDGRHQQLLRHIEVMRVLQPGDPETEVAIALSLALQESSEALQQQVSRLRSILSGDNLQQLTVMIRDLSEGLAAVRGWDAGNASWMDLLRNAVRCAGVLQSVTDTSSVLNARTGSLSASLLMGQPHNIEQPSESLTIRLTARFVAVAAGIATDNYGPFRKLVGDLQVDSPIRDDAFFPFVRGLTWIADRNWNRAVDELQLAREAPCLFSQIRSEIDYCLATTRFEAYTAQRRGPGIQNGDRLVDAVESAGRWQAAAEQLPLLRVQNIVDVYVAADQSELALALLTKAEAATPSDKLLWQLKRADVLAASGRFAETVQLVDQLLLEPSLTRDQTALLSTHREAAIQKMSTLLPR